MCACVRACARACVRARVRVCVRTCVRACVRAHVCRPRVSQKSTTLKTSACEGHRNRDKNAKACVVSPTKAVLSQQSSAATDVVISIITHRASTCLSQVEYATHCAEQVKQQLMCSLTRVYTPLVALNVKNRAGY